MKIKKSAIFGALICSLLISTIGVAPAGFADDKGMMLEEIIVSAQRRAQSLNDVPIAVQAFSEQMMLETGIVDPKGLATVTPNLNITTHLMGVNPYIRGVGNPIAATVAEASVAIYIDGSYIKSANASAFEFNNIERIEVIKGPQGTLFGRNATGGLIQIITKDPSHEPSLSGRFAVGDYETTKASLYGTTGITDNIAADIAINYLNQVEGWGTNLTTGRDVDEGKRVSVRTKWKWDVTEDTRITFSADYTDVESSWGTYNRAYPGSTPLFGRCPAPAAGLPCYDLPANLDFYDSVDPFPGDEWIKDSGAALTLEHAFGDLNFKSISTYRYTESGSHFDQVTSPFPLVEIEIDDQESNNFAQEFQLYSDTDSFDWIVGAFWFHDNAGFNHLYLSGPLIAGGAGVQELRGPVETYSWAVYGEGTYSITDNTRITLGARYTEDSRDADHSVYLNGSLILFSPKEADWEEPTYRLIIDHDLNEDTLVYASYSRGYKAGNFNSSAATAEAFNPEILDAWEIGAKMTLANGQTQLNMAAFYYDYSDLQTSRVIAGALFTVNAAAAKLYGVEADLTANVTDRLQVIAGIGWGDYEYDDFQDAPLYTPNPNYPYGAVQTAFDASGQKLPRVPEWTANIGGNYLLAEVYGGELKLEMNLYHNDGFYWLPSNRQEQEAYGFLHAGISWQSGDGKWGVRLYGDNLLDEEYSTYTSEQTIGDIFQPGPPRTYFAEMNFKF